MSAPACEELADERRWRHRRDARVARKGREEHHEVLLVARRIDDEILAPALLAQSLRSGDAHEKPAQPVGKVAADQEQVRAANRREETFRRLAQAGLEAVEELEDVFVVRGEHRRHRRLAEEVQNRAPVRRIQLAQVGEAILGQPAGRVFHLFGPGLTSVPDAIERLGQHVVARRRHEQAEVFDAGQLSQRRLDLGAVLREGRANRLVRRQIAVGARPLAQLVEEADGIVQLVEGTERRVFRR